MRYSLTFFTVAAETCSSPTMSRNVRLRSALETTIGARNSSPPTRRTPTARPSSMMIRSTRTRMRTSPPFERTTSTRCAGRTWPPPFG